jgi:hypothetical protein
MKRKRILRNIAGLGVGLTAVATLMLGGCGWLDSDGGGGGGTAATPPAGGGAPVVISGFAVKGRMFGATARVYEADSAGRGSKAASPRLLGTSDTTTATGAFKITLGSAPTTAVAIEISGGTYPSETDGKTITASTEPMTALLPLSSVTTGASGVAITPLSDMAHAHAVAHASLPGASAVALTKAIGDADAFVSKTFGLAASSPAAIVPDFSAGALVAKSDGGKLALALAALDSLVTKMAGSVPGIASRDDVYAALSDDYSDGLPDGKKFVPGSSVSTTVTISGASGVATLPSTALGFDLAREFGSVSARIASGSASGVFPGSTSEVASAAATVGVLATDAGTSVTSIIPKSVLTATGVSSTSSGAMSYLSTGGHQFLYIAARSKGVRKVDVTDPAAPFELTPASTPAWNGAALASNAAFGGNAIGGAMVVSSATGVQVLAFAYGAKHIALLDPDTGAVTYEGDLPLTGALMSFSGGSAFIAGAIPDPGKGAWLATTDGYVFLDINATLAAGPGAAPVLGATKFATGPVQCCSGGSPNQLAENLGGDIARNMLFTPNYGGLSLQVVADQPGGLAKGTYQLDPSFITAHPILSGNMDGGAVDTGFGVGIITYEDTRNASFINLNGITAGTPTIAGALTFVPPATNNFVDVNITTGFLEFSGSAVDSRTHQVFGMAGFSSDIFVGQIQDPASVASGATWSGMSDWVFHTLAGYSIAQDPHANVTLFNDKTGKTFAYLLDGFFAPTGVQQIDVSGLLAMPRAGTTGDAAHQPATSPQAAGGPITKIPLS